MRTQTINGFIHWEANSLLTFIRVFALHNNQRSKTMLLGHTHCPPAPATSQGSHSSEVTAEGLPPKTLYHQMSRDPKHSRQTEIFAGSKLPAESVGHFIDLVPGEGEASSSSSSSSCCGLNLPDYEDLPPRRCTTPAKHVAKRPVLAALSLGKPPVTLAGAWIPAQLVPPSPLPAACALCSIIRISTHR